MAQALRPNTAGGLFATDGKPHPLQDALLAVTLVLGLTSFLTAIIDEDLHLLSSWAGLVGILTGAWPVDLGDDPGALRPDPGAGRIGRRVLPGHGARRPHRLMPAHPLI